MFKIVKKSVALLVIAALLIIPLGSTAMAEEITKEATPGTIIVDAFMLRPVQNLAIVVGGAAFVVTLPFSAIGGNMSTAYEKLVVKPYKAAWDRPLGVF